MATAAVKSASAAQKPAPSTGPDATANPPPPDGILPNPLVDDLVPHHLKRGVLIPLKTTQEVRQDHTIVQALITRAPTKSANDVIS
jgi:tRNA-specific adenosine deaminase 3